MPFSCGVVEDQTLFRRMLSGLLVSRCGARVIFEAGSLAELRGFTPELRSLDLLLLDLRLPDGDGLDFIEGIDAPEAVPATLLLSAASEDFVIHRVTGSAIRGYVHKEEEACVLVEAVTTIINGGTYFSPRFLQRRSQLAQATHSFTKVLSGREQTILVHIGSGLGDAEVAAMLGLSTATVHVHRRSIMKKLGLHSAVALQAYALQHGFTSVRALSRGTSTLRLFCTVTCCARERSYPAVQR